MTTPLTNYTRNSSLLSPIQSLATYGGGLPAPSTNVVTKPNTTVVNPTTLATTSPIVIPQKRTTKTPPVVVAPPTGTTTDASGNAAPAQKQETPEQSNYQKVLDRIEGLGSSLKDKSKAEARLQKEEQLAQKTEQATKDYNAYIQAKLQHDQTLEQMRLENPGGQFGGAHQSDISNYERKSNANLANLAIQSQVSQGLEASARKTITDKLDAQFQPIKDQIDFYTKFAQLNQNDLSESEKVKLDSLTRQKEFDMKATYDVSNNLHQAVLDNGGNPAVLSAMDKVIEEYQSGKISPQQAQSQLYSAAGAYGGNMLQREKQQLEIQKLRNANVYSSNDPSRFTKTQLNVGTSRAGIPLEDFKQLDNNVKNFYINNKDVAEMFNEALTSVESGAATPEEVKGNIDEMDIPDSVKTYLKGEVDGAVSAPEEPGFFKNLWDGITGFFK